MKKLKVNSFMIAALAIAAVTMSFKMADRNVSASSLDVEVWQYTQSTTAGHSNPGNYIIATGSENCLGQTPVRCTLKAPDDGSGQPDLSMATDITFKAR